MKITVAGRCFEPPVWTLLVTLLAMAVLGRLGVWQLHRADYKQKLIQQFEARAQQAPLGWPALQVADDSLTDRKLRLAGHYDNGLTVWQANQFEEGRPGFQVFTVFRGEGGAVLVDRGWLPQGSNGSLPAVPAAQATTVEGLANMPTNGLRVGDEDYHSRPLKVLWLDPVAIGKALGLSLGPFVVRLDPAAADGFDRNWPPAVNPEFGPEKSRAYALQWFSMAAAVLVIFVVVNSRRTETS